MSIIIKPIIGIVGRPDKNKENDNIICVQEGYRRAVINSGGIPILLLPNQNFDYEVTRPRDAEKLDENAKEDLIKIIDLCDGIIMPGGTKWYEYDEFICEYAIKKDIPILGICMGMQVMASLDNRKLGSIVPNVKNETLINHQQPDIDYVHKVNIDKNSFLGKIINKGVVDVNSRHNYHIEKTNEFIISGYSEDGLIEAIELPNKKFVVGLQWHPERMLDFDQDSKKIFDKFIEVAKDGK